MKSYDLLVSLWDQVSLFVKSYFFFWLFFTVLEYIQPFVKQPILSKHQFNDVLNGLFVAVFLWPLDSFIKITIVENFMTTLGISNHSTIYHWPLGIQIVIGLFAMDLIQYIRHRILHTKFLWGFHAAHHSAIVLRSSTHFRVHPVDFFLSQVFYMSILYMIGFGPEALRWILIMVIVNNMWLHINVNINYLFPMNYVLTSPNYHKWHHTADKGKQNKNYADLFPILDRIGGTYYFPKDKLPENYGVMGVSKQASLHQTFLGTLLYPFLRKPGHQKLS